MSINVTEESMPDEWKKQADEMTTWAMSCGGGFEILFNGMEEMPACGRWQCIVSDGRADKEFCQGYGLTFEGAVSKCHSRFHSKTTGYEILTEAVFQGKG